MSASGVFKRVEGEKRERKGLEEMKMFSADEELSSCDEKRLLACPHASCGEAVHPPPPVNHVEEPRRC